MPRSGTNYLHRLLCLHPDCAPLQHEAVQEDFLLHHSSLLSKYADRLAWHWGHWGEAAPARETLLTALSTALTDFLVPSYPAECVVTKTPSVRNLEHLFEAFTDGRLLILIRDGRSVVASGMKGFDWNFEMATHKWAQAARNVRSFTETYGRSSERHLLLRYEDLNENPQAVLEQTFEFLDLPVSDYDFSDALNLPVYGSSFTGSDENEVTWQPESKPESFASTKRWADWSTGRHARFNWIAGSELADLGYEPEPVSQGVLHRLTQYLADIRYQGARLPTRVRSSIGPAARAFMEAFRNET